MRLIDRYIASAFVKNLLLALSSLVLLFLFQSILGDIFDQTFTFQQVLVYHGLNVPFILVQLAGPATLIAIVFTISSLGRSHELTALFSIGVGIQRIVGLIFVLVLVLCSFLLIVQDRLVPVAHRTRTLYYWHEIKHRNDFFLDIKMDKIWYRSKNFVYNLQRFDPVKNTVYGLSVYEFGKNFRLQKTVNADQASYLDGKWVASKGASTEFKDEEDFPVTRPFQNEAISLFETPKEFGDIDKEIEILRVKELYRYIKKMKETGADTKKMEIAFHSKINRALIPIVMCFLGIPFSGRGRRDGGSTAKDLGLGLLASFFYWFFYTIGLSMGNSGLAPPWVAAWFPSLVFGGLALILLTRRRTE